MLDYEEEESTYRGWTDRARKVMQLANQEAQRCNHETIGTEHILLGLMKEGSGVAANVLNNLAPNTRTLRVEVERIVPRGAGHRHAGQTRNSPRASKVIEYSVEEARDLNHNYVGTEHLLLGLLRDAREWQFKCWRISSSISTVFATMCWIFLCRGFDADSRVGRSTPPPASAVSNAPIAPVGPISPIGRIGPLAITTQSDVLRVLDAAANRGREGLRVIEDYVRFVLDDPHLTELCKQLRHDLTAALSPLSAEIRMAARETQEDVGTALTTASEQRRDDMPSVVRANFARLQESLRSLEEFGKLDGWP